MRTVAASFIVAFVYSIVTTIAFNEKFSSVLITGPEFLVILASWWIVIAVTTGLMRSIREFLQ